MNVAGQGPHALPCGVAFTPRPRFTLRPLNQGVVLIVSHEGDEHVELVERELARLDTPSVRFETQRYPLDAAAELTVERGVPRLVLRIGDAIVRGEEVAAVLHRHFRLPTAPAIADPQARELAESELRAALEGGLLSLQCRWINHPHAKRLRRSKPLQLALAARSGFAVPETLISRDPQRIRERHRAWEGRTVAKLVGGQIPAADVDRQYVVHTTLLEPEDLANDDALSAAPAIYQRYVEKDHELRVTVVGDEAFATRIDSQEHPGGLVDWRRAGPEDLRLSVAELDPDVTAGCRRITRALGLEFAGIDLIVTPQGEVVFLEVNAAGQWAWVERRTRQPIAASIARRLVAAGR